MRVEPEVEMVGWWDGEMVVRIPTPAAREWPEYFS